MKTVDIATDIMQDIGNPSDTSIPVIAYWLRANIGKLNTAINKSYFVDSTTLEIKCVDPNDSAAYEEIGIDEATILKLLYIIHYYDLKIRQNALSYDTRSAIEVTSDGHSVRLVSPTEIGKNLYMFRKGLADDLKQWIIWYRNSRSTPRQVAGDDTSEETASLIPPYPRTYYL